MNKENNPFCIRNRIIQVLYIAFCLIFLFSMNVFAAEDIFTAAHRIIKDVYNDIAQISTVLAGLMSAVAVIGAKMSNNRHKVDQSWD